MLEDFFVVPAAAQRLRSCSLGVHLDAFCARLADLGCLIFGGSPADFGKFIAGEIEKWTKVIRTAGIKAE